MSQDSHARVHVPADLLARHRGAWQVFVKFIEWGCVSMVVFLLLMLLFFKGI